MTDSSRDAPRDHGSGPHPNPPTHTERAPTHLDRIHRRSEADHAHRVVLRALHFVLPLLPHGPRQARPRRVLGLGRHRGDARIFVLLPVALLAGLAAVVRDLALRASAQRGAPALLAAQEAAEQVDPQDGFVALRLCGAELLVVLLFVCRLLAAVGGLVLKGAVSCGRDGWCRVG